MSGLILVDLDNVVGDSLSEFASRAAEGLHKDRERLAEERWTVVVAMNTETAIENGLTFEGVRAAGKRLAEALGDDWAVEVGLTLNMPQTADVLLEQLARFAPRARTDLSPHYSTALLFTKDTDLVRSLDAELFRGWSRIKRVSAPARYGKGWRMAEGGRRVTRKPPGKVKSGGKGRPPDSLQGYTVPIRGGTAIASWAGHRFIDVEPEHRELHQLARYVNEEPWVLSQLGATRRTVRGVGRMDHLPSSPEPVLGPISEKDGVEIKGTKSRPSQLQTPSEASVGIGAVRCDPSGTTVATKLPVSVLSCCKRPIQLDGRGVMLRAALQQLPEGTALGDATSMVCMRPGRTDLVAKVQHRGTEQPRMWWLRESWARSEHEVPGARDLLPAAVSSVALPMKNYDRRAFSVVLRSPFDRALVFASTEIQAGTIGQAWTHGGADAEIPVAVFAHARTIAAGERVDTVPIHADRAWAANGVYPRELANLPLLVPTRT